MTLSIRNQIEHSRRPWGESRLQFPDHPQTNAKKTGIRIHGRLVALILQLFSKIITLRTAEGKTIYFNKSSLFKWMRNQELPTPNSVSEIAKELNLIGKPSETPSPKEQKLVTSEVHIDPMWTPAPTDWFGSEIAQTYFEFLSMTHSNIQLTKPSGWLTLERIEIIDHILNPEPRHLTLEQALLERLDLATQKGTSSIKNFPFYVHVSGNHFVLVYVDRERRTLEYYDSLVNYGNHSKIREYLEKTARLLSEKDPGTEPFKLLFKVEHRLQTDGYQCGPWTLFFLEKRLKEPAFDFNNIKVDEASNLIAQFREQVVQQCVRMQRSYQSGWDRSNDAYEHHYPDDESVETQFEIDLKFWQSTLPRAEQWKFWLGGGTLTPEYMQNFRKAQAVPTEIR